MCGCSAYGCSNRRSKNISGITFHKFPKNKMLREKWILAVRRKDWLPSNASVLCSEHFSEDQFDRCSTLRVYLKPDSVPTKFDAFPDYLKEKLRKRNEERAQDSSDASVREVKKSRKLNPLPKRLDKSSRAKYDEKGFDKDAGLDLCDCLVEECSGCWMDCPSCGSRKCGHECRVYRRYKYDYVEIEGADMTIKNKYK